MLITAAPTLLGLPDTGGWWVLLVVVVALPVIPLGNIAGAGLAAMWSSEPDGEAQAVE